MDPAFPDIVGEWADQMDDDDAFAANDNGHGEDDADEVADTFLAALAMLDIEATRVW
jgi:hypothetical protein